MIVDASVAVKWFVAEAGSDDAVEIVAQHDLRAPPLLMTEVGNALWKKLRRGELSEPLDVLARHADIAQVVEIVDGNSNDLAVRALELALMLDHPIYDCVYLALAELEDDVLATADDAFRRKVQRSDLARHVIALGA